MSAVSAVLAAVLAIALGAVALLARRLRAQLRAAEAAARLRRSAQQAEQTAIRQLQLAAHDLRGVGMSLQGHADYLCATTHPHADGIATAAIDLLGMADELQDQSLEPGSARVLRDESVNVGDAVTEATAAVTASLGPGRRQWRIAPDSDALVLRADRRALRHVLTRVLADAVRSTRQDDWIDIGVQSRPDGVAVVVADEGAGLASPASGAPARLDSRGIGLRLALARGLMEAHGGRLDIEARVGVGTRVSLVFPIERRLSLPSRSYAATTPVFGGGGR